MRAWPVALMLVALTAVPAMACGPSQGGAVKIPPAGASLDNTQPRSPLSEEQAKRFGELSAEVKRLAAAKKEKAARAAEEQAMLILGYKKAWLACGPGTFMWMPANFGAPAKS